jgi:hypothetical protein
MKTFQQFMLEMGRQEYEKKLYPDKVASKPESALEKYKREGGLAPCKDGRFYKKEGQPWCPEDAKS